MRKICTLAREASSFQQGQRSTCQWWCWAGFCPAHTQTPPESKGGETSRAFWAREMASTWRPCPYGSSSLPWPRTFDCSTHAVCALLQTLAGGCTWDGTAEGQQSPCRQLQQGRATSNSQPVCAKNTDLAAEEGRRQGGSYPASREERKTKWEGGKVPWEIATSYLTGSQGHNTTSLAHCPRHFFQLLLVSYGPECLPSAALPLVSFSIAINKASTAFVQFFWTAA